MLGAWCPFSRLIDFDATCADPRLAFTLRPPSGWLASRLLCHGCVSPRRHGEDCQRNSDAIPSHAALPRATPSNAEKRSGPLGVSRPRKRATTILSPGRKGSISTLSRGEGLMTGSSSTRCQPMQSSWKRRTRKDDARRWLFCHGAFSTLCNPPVSRCTRVSHALLALRRYDSNLAVQLFNTIAYSTKPM